jgi:signal transduction histidine kinase
MQVGEGEREELLKKLDRTNEELNAILKISTSAFSTLEFDKLLNTILRSLLDTLKADAAVILLKDDGSVRVYSSIGVEEEARARFSMPIGQGFAGTIAQTQKCLYIKDAQSDPRVLSHIIRKMGVRTMLGVPMMQDNDTVGVLHIDWLNIHPFEMGELRILEASAARCAMAITNSRLYEKTRELKQQAELYIDIMGHDINNLNQQAMANLELIESDGNLNGEQRSAIKYALNAVRSSAAIIDNVRKIQAINEEKANFEPMDLNDIILACIREAPKPENKKVTINYDPRKGLKIISVSLTKEIFCNIISNAIKHSGSAVTIDIKADEVKIAGKKLYKISIADDGPGIPDDFKPKLFYRFQRGVTKAHGKGLGLFIARSLVELANGNIQVEDRVPGDYTKGAKFVVTLPVCEECPQ